MTTGERGIMIERRLPSEIELNRAYGRGPSYRHLEQNVWKVYGDDKQLEHVRELALHEMEKHDLLERGWSFAFDHAWKRSGQCDHWKKRITLSRVLAVTRSEADVTKTIRHEIAHALVGSRTDRNGAKPHGAEWKAKAKKLGVS